MRKGFPLPKLDLSKAQRIIEDKMGIGLSHPVTSKVLYRKGSKTYRVGAAQMQGTTSSFPTLDLSLYVAW
jgi:hypothetical protein